MDKPLTLGNYSIGVGDRFAHQAEAQLQACIEAAKQGVDITPVWNKSNREHGIIGSRPEDTRQAADAAVQKLGWTEDYYIDADHINLSTVEKFIGPCDFYTIDVADSIGKSAESADLEAFVRRHPELEGSVVSKYLTAVKEAGQIYREIQARKGAGNFITEVSMDETDSPQTPRELQAILAAIADEKIPIQTIAPKFTGRFNKGVDYQGNLAQFTKEFADDVQVIASAVQQYDLPGNLKLSVHSGSDKFSIYEPMRETLRKFNAGVHLKTAGTNWLEELIGLAESGGEGLELAKEIYAGAYAKRSDLCAPYAAVIDIDPNRLPTPDEVNRWSSEQFVAALRHDPQNPEFNSSLRQLLHVGFKIAAQMGDRYLSLLEKYKSAISKNVTSNLFDKHIRPLFIGS